MPSARQAESKLQQQLLMATSGWLEATPDMILQALNNGTLIGHVVRPGAKPPRATRILQPHILLKLLRLGPPWRPLRHAAPRPCPRMRRLPVKDYANINRPHRPPLLPSSQTLPPHLLPGLHRLLPRIGPRCLSSSSSLLLIADTSFKLNMNCNPLFSEFQLLSLCRYKVGRRI